MILHLLLTALIATSTALAVTQDDAWTLIGDEHNHALTSYNPEDLPIKFKLYRFNEDVFKQNLTNSQGPSRDNYAYIPDPQGQPSQVVYWDSSVMHSELAAENPRIITFQGFNAQREAETIRFDLSQTGFHAQGYSTEGIYYISPMGGDLYLVYYGKNYRPLQSFGCDEHDSGQQEFKGLPVGAKVNYGTQKRTYRLAIAATGEYTTASGGAAAALSSIVTAVNFINGIYELEIGVKLQLVANNSSLIYTNAAGDPFTPELGIASMLPQNQTNTDLVIGSANYDIAHVVHNVAGASNTGAGVATLSAACNAATKARGVSSASRIGQTPMNPFFYRVLVHEIGHQYGAHHTFNSSCSGNRNDPTAYEPGSGTTIMSYAGGCSPYNVTTLADTYFHRISLEEIASFIAGAGGSCPVVTNTGNAIPTADAGASYIIPRSTPFILTGAGTDANGNPLTYSWEQYNNEIATMPPVSTATGGPNFRSVVPTSTTLRYFPRLIDVLANTSPVWEVLPSVGRVLNYSLVVRDGVGGVASDDTTVTVDGASGPFVVTSPNGGETRRLSMVVTWNPASTNVAPINTSQVDILLSINNGSSFTSVLANNTPNDGSQTVSLPIINTTLARIQVRAEGNIFYDVSNGPFTITP